MLMINNVFTSIAVSPDPLDNDRHKPKCKESVLVNSQISVKCVYFIGIFYVPIVTPSNQTVVLQFTGVSLTDNI